MEPSFLKQYPHLHSDIHFLDALLELKYIPQLNYWYQQEFKLLSDLKENQVYYINIGAPTLLENLSSGVAEFFS